MTGLQHLSVDDASWNRLDVHGTTMDKATIFEGNYGVRSAFFKLACGQTIHNHTHTKWVQVMVLDGKMRVQQEGTAEFDAPPGHVYFLDPGHPHVETAVEDATLLVTQGEDRPGWM